MVFALCAGDNKQVIYRKQVNESMHRQIRWLLCYARKIRKHWKYVLVVSSLDCRIWHSFCSFSYSQVCSDRIDISSDVINCRRKKWERKSTLSTALNALLVGSTHSVLLPMNVILVKDCEESNSPTSRKWAFLLYWNFFWTTITS